MREELLLLKTSSGYVFAAYNEQLRSRYERAERKRQARMVGTEFNPVNLGDWFHERIVEWSQTTPKGRATTHIFRKTTLQYARRGEDINRSVAQDARLSEGVAMTNFVKETDEEMRAKSNRKFQRILAGLPVEVTRRYGQETDETTTLKERIKAAASAEDWKVVTELTAELQRLGALTPTAS